MTKYEMNSMIKRSKINLIRLSLAVVAGLAAVTVSSQAQTATATLTWVAAGDSFDYTITLHNTGTVALNGFWYGWTTGGDNLPSAPSSAGNSSGWGNVVSGNSIQWMNNSYTSYGYTYYYGTPLAPGASATFTFVSSTSPSAIATSPSGKSVAYVGGIDSSEGTVGDSTAVFSPAPASPPPVVPTVTATISGVAAGGSYDYTVTLQNTGTVALNSFWYGWTTGGNNLASDPTTPGNSLGWSNVLSGNSIKWTNSSGTALAAGASATFTFVSSAPPSAITMSPSGESVAYVGGIDFSQDKVGDSTGVFSPTLTAPPPAVPTVTATISGVAAGDSYDYTITLQNTEYRGSEQLLVCLDHQREQPDFKPDQPGEFPWLEQCSLLQFHQVDEQFRHRLGAGSFGHVHLCQRQFTPGHHHAAFRGICRLRWWNRFQPGQGGRQHRGVLAHVGLRAPRARADAQFRRPGFRIVEMDCFDLADEHHWHDVAIHNEPGIAGGLGQFRRAGRRQRAIHRDEHPLGRATVLPPGRSLTGC